MSEKTIVKHAPGELIDFETIFTLNPDIEGKPTKVGHVEHVEYKTAVYEDGKTYRKYCNVYLPYGYDPADKGKKYNVLYYQHGNTCDPEIFAGQFRTRFDLLFESGEIEPCIIVSTTYYFDVGSDVATRKRTGGVPAGDGGWPGVKPNFWREVVEDIIPAVELKYNTYLTEDTPEAIKASRDHRAFAGYSRGAVATWYVFHNAFEYFRWYAPMSCMTTAGKAVRGEPATPEEVMAYLEAPIKTHPELPFYIFASNGGPNDVVRMTEQMKYIPKGECFCYGPDPKKNNIFFSVSEFRHTDLLVPYYYWNSLQVLFK